MPPVDDRFDYDEEYGDENTPPSWFPGGHLPADARRMGLTHHVPDGALLDFAGKLDATKPLAPDHRLGAAGRVRAAGRLRGAAAVRRSDRWLRSSTVGG